MVLPSDTALLPHADGYSPAAVVISSLKGQCVLVQPEAELISVLVGAAGCYGHNTDSEPIGAGSGKARLAAHELLELPVVALKDQGLFEA